MKRYTYQRFLVQKLKYIHTKAFWQAFVYLRHWLHVFLHMVVLLQSIGTAATIAHCEPVSTQSPEGETVVVVGGVAVDGRDEDVCTYIH